MVINSLVLLCQWYPHRFFFGVFVTPSRPFFCIMFHICSISITSHPFVFSLYLVWNGYNTCSLSIQLFASQCFHLSPCSCSGVSCSLIFSSKIWMVLFFSFSVFVPGSLGSLLNLFLVFLLVVCQFCATSYSFEIFRFYENSAWPHG